MKGIGFLALGFAVVLIGWFGSFTASAGGTGEDLGIVYPQDSSFNEALAAREICRYVYLRTGRLLPLVAADKVLPPLRGGFVVGRKERFIFEALSQDESLKSALSSLEVEEYWLKTLGVKDGRYVLVAGGSDASVLYGAYRLAEHFGVRFYLHGDVMPDESIELEVPNLDERRKPLFPLRGIQPFHDFPEGPDWWNLDHYKAVISQLPKMGMNFIGLHTYPEGGVGPEPTVWIGLPRDVGQGAKVEFAYPASWMNTLRGNWGYKAKETREFSFGAAELFPHEAYGNEVMIGFCPQPDEPGDCREVFERAGLLLKEAFEHARSLRVKTCVGTETPLVVPKLVRDRMDAGKAREKAPWVKAVGGNTAQYESEISNTQDQPLYKTVRWALSGYQMALPNGAYRMTLKFCELHYGEKGKRIFGVKIQGREVIEKLDIFEEAGKNRALDFSFENIRVTDGSLSIEFTKNVEFPCIAALAVEGNGFAGKVNCGGERYRDYEADAESLPLSPSEVQELYEGIFTRIAQTYPLDFYWLWTPEGWTWEEVPDDQVEATIEDLRIAHAAAKEISAPFTLATCGWVLGPPKDRALFHRVLPGDMPLSCINRQVGKDPVEPGFAEVRGRLKWAIPWLEDDPNMICPQLWAGRMRKDAADALKYGCTGLMGIHWRTRILGPNVSALAKAAWDQEGWSKPEGRYLPTLDFYLDWAASQFGPEKAQQIGEIFERIDGRLPIPSTWIHGPGGIAPDERPWEKVEEAYGFVIELEELRDMIQGAGSRERFDYWLNNFRYMMALERVKNLRARYNRVMKEVRELENASRRTGLAEEAALPLRIELVKAAAEVSRLLLATASSPGELGTVANWEQHTLPDLLEGPGRELAEILGRALPAEAQPSHRYSGPLRIIVPTVRTSLSRGEDLKLEVIILCEEKPQKAALHWRPLGQGKFSEIPLSHVARGVYRVSVPVQGEDTLAVEYYIDAQSQRGERAIFPPTATAINQTVVMSPSE